MIKVKKTLKGFTLIELIVVMALMTILMGAILALVTPVGTLFKDSSEYTQERAVTQGLIDYVNDTTRYSKDLIIFKDWPSVPEITIGNGLTGYTAYITADTSTPAATNENTGRLFKTIGLNATPQTYLVMGEAYYGNYSYEFDYDKLATNGDYLVSKIRVNQIIRTVSTFKLENESTIFFPNIEIALSKDIIVITYDHLVPANNEGYTPSVTPVDTTITNTYIFYKLP